jgi:hypothetical protein
MPAANPFAPTIELGGNVGAGPVSTSAGFSLGVSDNHVAAGWAILALALLVLLWKSKFRFSTTVG